MSSVKTHQKNSTPAAASTATQMKTKITDTTFIREYIDYVYEHASKSTAEQLSELLSEGEADEWKTRLFNEVKSIPVRNAYAEAKGINKFLIPSSAFDDTKALISEKYENIIEGKDSIPALFAQKVASRASLAASIEESEPESEPEPEHNDFVEDCVEESVPVAASIEEQVQTKQILVEKLASYIKLSPKNSSKTLRGAVKQNVEDLHKQAEEMKLDWSKLTFKQRVAHTAVPLKDYLKHDGTVRAGDKSLPSDGEVTGYVGLNNLMKNISIVDIDINKELDSETKSELRQQFLDKLPEDCIVVKTGNDGLHVWCNLDGFELCKKDGTLTNRVTKAIETDNYDVDVFASSIPESDSFIVLPGTQIIHAKDDEFGEYEFIRGNENLPITHSLSEILDSLEFEEFKNTQLERKQQTESKCNRREQSKKTESNKTTFVNEVNSRQEEVKSGDASAADKQQSELSSRGTETVTYPDNVLRALVDGIQSPIEIHNDTHDGNGMKEEVSLMLFCQTLNSIEDEELRELAYKKGEDCMTRNALKNVESIRKRNEGKKISLSNLHTMIKVHNQPYYENNVKPLFKMNYTNFSSETNINLKDTSFDFVKIQKRVEDFNYAISNEKTHEQATRYKTKMMLAYDLSKIFAIIKNTQEVFRKNTSRRIPHLCEMEPIGFKEFKDQLSNLKVKTGEFDKYNKWVSRVAFTGFDAYTEHQSHFSVVRESKLFDKFIGYWYDPDIMYNKMLKDKMSFDDLEKKYFSKIFPHMRKMIGERVFFEKLEELKENYRTHRKIGKLDIMYGEHGVGKTIWNRIIDEVYRGNTFDCDNFALLLDKEDGNIDGYLRIHVEEWDVLDTDRQKNARLKAMITGVGEKKGRLLHKNFFDITNNVDIYTESNHLPVGLLLAMGDSEEAIASERRIRGAVCTRVKHDFEDDDAYFIDLMREIEPNGEGNGFNKEFMYALSTYLYYAPMDRSYNPRGKPKMNKFKEMLNFAALCGGQYIDFTRTYLRSLVGGILAEEFDNLVDSFLHDHPFKREYNRGLIDVTSTYFKQIFGKFILASHKMSAKELHWFSIFNNHLTKDMRVYRFENVEDFKKFCDSDEMYEELVESRKEFEEFGEKPIEKYESELAGYEAEMRSIKNKMLQLSSTLERFNTADPSEECSTLLKYINNTCQKLNSIIR